LALVTGISGPVASSGTMGRMIATEALSQAGHVAEEVLFPAAMKVDAADRIPAAHFDALARAGLYGLAGPVGAGGLDADLATFCSVIEIMAGVTTGWSPSALARSGPGSRSAVPGPARRYCGLAPFPAVTSSTGQRRGSLAGT
jgi:alkylation response protein AidB-like acyl-CoA dehydrogenase